MKKNSTRVREVMEWFSREVTYRGEAYSIDYEQANAVICDAMNTIVVARAGSGKTRTIVAKIVYLIARYGVKPSEILVFVFNANAAVEINARLAEMRVNGRRVTSKGEEVRIASTFHAFSRKVVYGVCSGKERCGKILAGEKEAFVHQVVREMMDERKWSEVIWRYVKDDLTNSPSEPQSILYILEEEEVLRVSGEMVNFINRAQQKYLGGGRTLEENIREHLASGEVIGREKLFLELGLECYKRYHRYLLDEEARRKLGGGLFLEYGTDFNLIVSWASRLIARGGAQIEELLSDKKYILVDEYQDFSQLFLAEVVAIRSVAKRAKLFVVGDDWQAINRFAGSEVEFFKEFEKFFPEEAKRLVISTNYRCNREIVNVARGFIRRAMKEKGDFRAYNRGVGRVVVVNPRETALDYGMVEYDMRVNKVDRSYKSIVQRIHGRIPKKTIVGYFKTLVEILRENTSSEILILHRNNDTNLEGISLEKFGRILKKLVVELGVMREEEFERLVRIMTMHKSKGLESEVVIILEADEGVIPKVHPDTSLYSVFGETEEVSLIDQIRLFYVAMTRAKKRLYIIHDPTKGAGFMKYLGRFIEKWGE